MFSKIFDRRRSAAGAGQRPSRVYQSRPNDQLPFLTRARFSALPAFHSSNKHDSQENLTLFIAILYVIDLFGVFPFITLPWLLVQLGVFGLFMVILVIVLQIYTSFLLSQCWTMASRLDASIIQKKRYPYAAIADLAYGRKTSLLVTILLDLSIFSMGLPTLVVAAENLELVGLRMSDNRFDFSSCYWIIVVGLFVCPLMWLGSPKHMRSLAILSICVLITIVILLWFCLFAAKPVGRPFEGISLDFPSFPTILNGYNILSFQFDIHPMLLTLQIDMQRKSQVAWAAFTGITVTCGVAIVGSIIAAYKFGSMIAENLLETLPKSVPLFCLLILMAFQLSFSSVVGSSAMFLQIENHLKIPEAFSFKRVAIRTSVIALEVVLAEFIPNFGTLMDVVGGTITGPLVFIVPPLLYRRIRRLESAQQRVAMEASYGSIPIALNYEENADDSIPLIAVPENTGTSLSSRLQNCCHAFQCDLPMSVLIFGILATLISTYLNIFELSKLFRNNSQCFSNITRDL